MQPITTRILIALIAAAATVPCEAQTVTGSIAGTVRDSSQAPVPGAQIRLQDIKTNATQTAATDASGNYTFPSLQPSAYTLTTTKQGFRDSKISDIEVQVGQAVGISVVLQVGNATEQITVNAGGVQLVQTQSGDVGQVLEQVQTESLPLDGRQFLQLVNLSNGAVPLLDGKSVAGPWTGRSLTVSTNGGRESNNSYLINGIEVRSARFGNIGFQPSLDAVQEFKVQTSSFGAEFGHSADVINTSLRSGSNAVHGSLFEFDRNNQFDGNGFFNNLNHLEAPHFSQNQFGGSLGGPVYLPRVYNGRNKTFFFFSYEGFRQRLGETNYGVLPSAGQLEGNLADNAEGTGIMPANSAYCMSHAGASRCKNVIDPENKAPFPNNVIPASRLNPVALEALQYVPAANMAVDTNSPNLPAKNYVVAQQQSNTWDQINARFDHQIGSRDQLYGTFSRHNDTLYQPNLMPLRGVDKPLYDRLITVTETHVFSPTAINTFRFGTNANVTFNQAETANTINYAADKFGLQNTSTNPFDFGVPDFGITGFSTIGSQAESVGANQTSLEFTEDFRKVAGRHTLAIGGGVTHQKFFQITDTSGIPSFTFDGRYSGNALADFLLGYPYTETGAEGDSSQHLRTTFFDGYFQDEFRATPNLTLNLGLRYEYATPVEDINGRTEYFDLASGSIVLSGKSPMRPDRNNIAPRFGFAYHTPLAGIVVRGGGGIFYSTDNWNELQFLVLGPPFYEKQSITGNTTTPNLSLSTALPSFSFSPNLSPYSINPGSRTPFSSQWNLDLQKTVFRDNLLIDIGYVGNKGEKLPQRRDVNAASIDPTGTIALAARRPYADFSNIVVSANQGWSFYNGLNVKLQARPTHDFNFLVAYTYSKCLDLGITDDNSAMARYYNIYDKGNCDYSTPQRLVGSGTWFLPLGRGHRLLSNWSLARAAFSGWRVATIATFQKGQFTTPTWPSDWMNIGGSTQNRPNAVGAYYPQNQSYLDWFNFSSFVRPTTHIEGNAARNSLEVPGVNTWNLSIMRDIRVRERANLQVRGEMFNAFNHTNFGRPSASVTAGQFGVITTLAVPARQIQLAMRLSF